MIILQKKSLILHKYRITRELLIASCYKLNFRGRAKLKLFIISQSTYIQRKRYGTNYLIYSSTLMLNQHLRNVEVNIVNVASTS